MKNSRNSTSIWTIVLRGVFMALLLWTFSESVNAQTEISNYGKAPKGFSINHYPNVGRIISYVKYQGEIMDSISLCWSTGGRIIAPELNGVTKKFILEAYLLKDTLFKTKIYSGFFRKDKSIFTKEERDTYIFMSKRGHLYTCERKDVLTGKTKKEYIYPIVAGFIVLVSFIFGAIGFIKSILNYHMISWVFLVPFYIISLIAIFFQWGGPSSSSTIVFGICLIGFPLLACILHLIIFIPLINHLENKARRREMRIK